MKEKNFVSNFSNISDRLFGLDEKKGKATIFYVDNSTWDTVRSFSPSLSPSMLQYRGYWGYLKLFKATEKAEESKQGYDVAGRGSNSRPREPKATH